MFLNYNQIFYFEKHIHNKGIGLCHQWGKDSATIRVLSPTEKCVQRLEWTHGKWCAPLSISMAEEFMKHSSQKNTILRSVSLENFESATIRVRYVDTFSWRSDQRWLRQKQNMNDAHCSDLLKRWRRTLCSVTLWLMDKKASTATIDNFGLDELQHPQLRLWHLAIQFRFSSQETLVDHWFEDSHNRKLDWWPWVVLRMSLWWRGCLLEKWDLHFGHLKYDSLSCCILNYKIARD